MCLFRSLGFCQCFEMDLKVGRMGIDPSPLLHTNPCCSFHEMDIGTHPFLTYFKGFKGVEIFCENDLEAPRSSITLNLTRTDNHNNTQATHTHQHTQQAYASARKQRHASNCNSKHKKACAHAHVPALPCQRRFQLEGEGLLRHGFWSLSRDEKYTPPPWKPPFPLFRALRPLIWCVSFYPDLWCILFSLVSQGHGIHHSLFCSVTLGSGDRPPRRWCILFFPCWGLGVVLEKSGALASFSQRSSVFRVTAHRRQDQSRIMWSLRKGCWCSEETSTAQMADSLTPTHIEASSKLRKTLSTPHIFIFQRPF